MIVRTRSPMRRAPSPCGKGAMGGGTASEMCVWLCAEFWGMVCGIPGTWLPITLGTGNSPGFCEGSCGALCARTKPQVTNPAATAVIIRPTREQTDSVIALASDDTNTPEF